MQNTFVGNKEILKNRIVCFHCSKKFSSKSICASIAWAKSISSECSVISTFRSPIERDVLEILLLRKIPVIIMLGRRHYRRVPDAWKAPLEEGRLLFISIFDESRYRMGPDSYFAANRYILSIANEAVFGCIAPGSSTEKIFNEAQRTKSVEKISTL